MSDDAQNEGTGKRERRVAVVLHFDTWVEGEDGETVRIPAAPELIDADGNKYREETALLPKEAAERLVRAGKATVPLK